MPLPARTHAHTDGQVENLMPPSAHPVSRRSRKNLLTLNYSARPAFDGFSILPLRLRNAADLCVGEVNFLNPVTTLYRSH